MNSNGYFITGTDTGVGKTLITCAIARAIRNQGRHVGVYKPAETGCEAREGVLIGKDAELLLKAAKNEQTHIEVCPMRFHTPAAPLAAAEAEGRSIQLETLVQRARKLSERFEILLVEGAGGLLVPLTPTDTYADLAKKLDLPVIVVIGAKLGCLNHTLLTLETLKARHIPVAGFVLNELSTDPFEKLAHQTHRGLLARFTLCQDLGHFPFLMREERNDLDILALRANQHLNLGQLF